LNTNTYDSAFCTTQYTSICGAADKVKPTDCTVQCDLDKSLAVEAYKSALSSCSADADCTAASTTPSVSSLKSWCCESYKSIMSDTCTFSGGESVPPARLRNPNGRFPPAVDCYPLAVRHAGSFRMLHLCLMLDVCLHGSHPAPLLRPSCVPVAHTSSELTQLFRQY